MPESRPRRVKNPESIAKTYRRHIQILLAVTFVTFISALPGDFVWTDSTYVVEGTQRIRSFQDIADVLRYTAPQYRTRLDGPPISESSGSWQPITTLDLSLGWAIWRDCAFCFRLEGLLLHFATVLGFLALGRHLLSQRRRGNSVALWAAMGFAVHPIVVPVVSSSQGRPVLLATALATWGIVLFSRLPPTSKSHHRDLPRWWIWLAAAAAAAIGAWDLALAMPVAALLIAWFDSSERERPGLRGISRKRIAGLMLLSAFGAAYFLYRLAVFGGFGFAGTYPTDSLVRNLGTALRLFWQHLSVVLVPGEPVISDAFRITTAWGAREVAALLGLSVWIAITVFGLKTRHPAALGSAWFLLWSLPVTGVFPLVRYYSEAALYPAYWGLMFGVAFLLMQLWRPIGRQLTRGSEAVMFGPIILTIAFISALSNVRFWSDQALFESEVDNDPYYIEGRSILSRLSTEQGLVAEPLDQALKAIEASQDRKFTGFYPKFDVFSHLGHAQLEMRYFDEAESSFNMALSERPTSASANHGLGRALLGLGDSDGAMRAFETALKLKPDFLPAQADLGIAMIGQKKYEQGLEYLAAGLSIGLDDYGRRMAMANAFIELKELERAQQNLDAALGFSETSEARAKLAWVQWKLGKRAKARENINIALQLDEYSSSYVLEVARLITAE